MADYPDISTVTTNAEDHTVTMDRSEYWRMAIDLSTLFDVHHLLRQATKLIVHGDHVTSDERAEIVRELQHFERDHPITHPVQLEPA